MSEAEEMAVINLKSDAIYLNQELREKFGIGKGAKVVIFCLPNGDMLVKIRRKVKSKTSSSS